MGAGSVVAGFIVLVLGAAGLLSVFGYMVPPLNLASITILFTRNGAILLYGAMAVIGIALMADAGSGGSNKRKEDVLTVSEVQKLGLTDKPQVVLVGQAAQPAFAGRTLTILPSELSVLDLAILRRLSERQSRKEIARNTGVSENVVSERVDELRSEGYVTSEGELTQKGYEAIRPTGFEALPSNPQANQ